MTSNRTLSTRNMILCALFTALIAVGAFIRIPVPFVPFTLQVLFVNLAALILGSRLGAVASGLYLVLGLLGLPIVTQGGGLFYVFQPTFGYIIGFVIGSFVAGLIVERAGTPTMKTYLGASAANLAIIYLCGVVYYYLIIHFYLGTSMGIGALLLYCFVLCVPGDIVLCIAGSALAKRVRPLAAKGAVQ